MIAEADVPDDVAFRMTPQDDGFNFELVKPYPGDVTFAHAEKIVLAIDEQVSESLAKFLLDVEFVDEEPNLFLTKAESR